MSFEPSLFISYWGISEILLNLFQSAIKLIYAPSAFRNIQGGIVTIIESINTSLEYCWCDIRSNGGQTTTTFERRPFNVRHAGRNLNRGQATTSIERTKPDAGHAVADGDGGQAITTIKRQTSNTGHAVGNDN